MPAAKAEPRNDVQRDNDPDDGARKSRLRQPGPAIHTRKRMKEDIEAGRSIILNGEVITSVDDLPSEAELAQLSGDADRIDSVKQDTKSRMAALKAELAQLEDAEGEEGEEEEPKKETAAQKRARLKAESSAPAHETAAQRRARLKAEQDAGEGEEEEGDDSEETEAAE